MKRITYSTYSEAAKAKFEAELGEGYPGHSRIVDTNCLDDVASIFHTVYQICSKLRPEEEIVFYDLPSVAIPTVAEFAMVNNTTGYSCRQRLFLHSQQVYFRFSDRSIFDQKFIPLSKERLIAAWKEDIRRKTGA